MRSLSALHIEDSERDHQLFVRHMRGHGIELRTKRVETVAAMKEALGEESWDVIICDFSMPQFGAPEALKSVRDLGLDTPFIIISGTVGEEEAVRALKSGANDYLMKDNLARLIPAIEREMQDAENRAARHSAEESLKISEAELRALFAAMNDIVLVLGRDGRHLKLASSNSNYSFGPIVEVVGRTVDEVYGRETGKRMCNLIGYALDKGVTQRLEYSLSVDGRDVWYEGSFSPMTSDKVILVARDITERKAAEIGMRESEARFKSLFRSIPIPIWVYDVETLRFLKVNDVAVEQYGYSREEFLSMTIKDIRPPEDVPLLMRRVGNPTRQMGYQGVWRHRKKDGTLIDVEISVHDIHLEGRLCMLVAATDVTLRRLAEHQLIKSEERYRDLVENAHDIIYSHDLNGNYISINEAGERITGYSRDEALNLNIADTVAPEFVQKAREMIKAKLDGEDTTAYELEILAKDGSRVCVEVNTKLIEHDGVPVGVQGIARDITARKRLEEQLLQAQKLESVGRLAGGIAHDFNNMLTAINGYSDLTLRQLPEDHKVRRNIEEIKKAGERSAQLTNQLLAFSRRQMLHPEVVNLNEVLSDTTQILRRVIGEDVELITDLDPAVGSVKVDPGQLSQIIMNLAINARDAMPDGGKLTIKTENSFIAPDQAAAVTGLLPGAYVNLSVSDNGTGIDDSDLQHIFEPFFTTKDVGKGTGLGLSTVYGIVRQSGGGISVTSEVGEGTTFDLYLPRVAEESAAEAEIVEQYELPIGPETILLVEDEDAVRSLLNEVLQACGYDVLTASNGQAALEICEKTAKAIDLLITDVVMPQMGGRELAERLSRILPDLPVLFVSGYTDDALVRESLVDADVNFIQKPFTLEGVSRKIRSLLDASKRRRSAPQVNRKHERS